MPTNNPGAATLAFQTNLSGIPTTLSAIDFHSPTNTLYGCTHDGTTMRWYRVNTSNGNLVPITTGSFGGTSQWELSYDPSTQVFEIQYGATNDNQAVGTTPGTLVPKTSLSGVAVGIAEIAHTNQAPGVAPSSAFGIDLVGKNLVQLGTANSTGPADAGTGSLVGPLGLTTTLDPFAGFDIDDVSGKAYAALSDP